MGGIRMIQLIKNVHVFRQGAWRLSEILIAGNKIEQIADQISMEYDGLTVIDGRGMRAIPGYIDQHVHVTGGGGEGSPALSGQGYSGSRFRCGSSSAGR